MEKNLFRPVLAKAALCPFKGVVLLAGILLVCSCDFPGNLPDGAGGLSSQGAGGPSPQGAGHGESSLMVILSGISGTGNTRSGGRSVLSDSFTGSLEYKVTFTGPGGTVSERTATGGSFVHTLTAGEWAIAAQAYAPPGVSGGPLVGTGTAAVTVTPGQNQGVTILMYVDPAYEATLTQIYIHNEAELRRVGVDFAIGGSISFYLERDIVLTQPWTPIGDTATPFKAVFNGQGHRVTMSGGFDSAALGKFDLGLFGYADGAEIKNLNIELAMGSAASPVQIPMQTGDPSQFIGGLAGRLANASKAENVSVKGSFCIKQTGITDGLVLGGIAGLVTGGSEIQSCSVSDMVLSGNSDTSTSTGGVAGASDGGSILTSSFSGTVNSGGLAGGIAGSNYNGLISGSHAAGTIKGADGAGGIAGEMQTSGGTASIAASSFTGTVSAENTGGAAYAGGVLGQSWSGSIARSYAAGNVKAQGSDAYAGGIAGHCNGLVSDCYAYANVLSNGSGTESFAGGIGGYTPELARCYAAGTVKAEGISGTAVYAGGISGQVTNTGGLNNCMVLLDALDGGSSVDVHTLFGGVYIWHTSNSGNKVWDAIAITQGGVTYKDGTGTALSVYPFITNYDIASFNSAASFTGSANQATYTNWDFTPGTGAWKYTGGYDYPVLSWQTAPPDLSSVQGGFVIIWP